ncbi:MAG: thiamine biosynthesis protein ThiF [Blastopirellula sp.]|nr:MAG: thiamine biosynthesis protein ThiF [Blastopirellula sp.]
MSNEPLPQKDLSRYARQISYAPLGEAGQKKLSQSRALVVGVGALGSVIANTLARAGVGNLRIVDRDFLELNNLQRQVMYTEQDVASGIPKAIAAKNHLEQINSEINIEAIVSHVNHQNLPQLLDGVDVIVDGTDNFEVRFLLNDAALKYQIPWIYGGCIGAEGQTMTVVPGVTPCLRCLMHDTPPPGTTPTCDTAGIVSPIINVIASLESMEAIKILSGNVAQIDRKLRVIDLWSNRMRELGLDSLQANTDCPACGKQQYDWLEGDRCSQTAVLCGRNAVQLSFPEQESVDFSRLAEKLHEIGKVESNRFLLRLFVENYILSIFSDGRAIISGTNDETEARSVYARYIGN